MAISEAITDAQRAEAQALFEVSFHDIAPTAVPRVKHDPLYAPLVLCYRDPGTGELAGAALTCRSQVAVSMTMMRRPEYAPVMDLHSELDLMAVVPAFRGRGIGGMLIRAMEDRLRQRGVRSWFATPREIWRPRSSASSTPGTASRCSPTGSPCLTCWADRGCFPPPNSPRSSSTNRSRGAETVDCLSVVSSLVAAPLRIERLSAVAAHSTDPLPV